MEEHPRFITTFVDKVSSSIDPDFLGPSTITWWQSVEFQTGRLKDSKPLYYNFRKTLISDLSESERVSATGLTSVLVDIISFCFAGEPCNPPPSTVSLLEALIAPNHAIGFHTKKGI